MVDELYVISPDKVSRLNNFSIISILNNANIVAKKGCHTSLSTIQKFRYLLSWAHSEEEATYIDILAPDFDCFGCLQ